VDRCRPGGRQAGGPSLWVGRLGTDLIVPQAEAWAEHVMACRLAVLTDWKCVPSSAVALGPGEYACCTLEEVGTRRGAGSTGYDRAAGDRHRHAEPVEGGAAGGGQLRGLGPAGPPRAGLDDTCPPDPVNLAEHRIRRKQILGGLTPRVLRRCVTARRTPRIAFPSPTRFVIPAGCVACWWATACPVDLSVGSRSQILMLAMSTVPL
jgi:hypothetical protein